MKNKSICVVGLLIIIQKVFLHECSDADFIYLIFFKCLLNIYIFTLLLAMGHDELLSRAKDPNMLLSECHLLFPDFF